MDYTTLTDNGYKLYERDDGNNNIEIELCTIYHNGFRFKLQHLIYTECDEVNFFTVWQFNGNKCITHNYYDTFKECTDFIKTI